jgi:ADP-ribosylglycohydrolase
MIWAGNFGRDADTISAVVGALAGALHGETVIPSAWIQRVDQPAGVCLKFAASKSMRGLASQLVDLMA